MRSTVGHGMVARGYGGSVVAVEMEEAVPVLTVTESEEGQGTVGQVMVGSRLRYGRSTVDHEIWQDKEAGGGAR